MKDRYGITILRNIGNFLEDLDEQTRDYYQKVADQIERQTTQPGMLTIIMRALLNSCVRWIKQLIHRIN